MGRTVTVTPRYGRDYKSKKAALADWNADKDFTLCDVELGYGLAINKADAEREGLTAKIRYNKLTRVFIANE